MTVHEASCDVCDKDLTNKAMLLFPAHTTDVRVLCFDCWDLVTFED